MAEVRILVPGYAVDGSHDGRYCSTITLVRTGPHAAAGDGRGPSAAVPGTAEKAGVMAPVAPPPPHPGQVPKTVPWEPSPNDSTAAPGGGPPLPVREQVVVVDPGTVQDPRIITRALAAEKLQVEDVDVVFITHSHLDHYRNLGLFPRAAALDWWGLWTGDRCRDWQEQWTADLRVLRTPGHSCDSLTLLCRTCRGMVAVCGDVFWKENFPETDPYAEDADRLRRSREEILRLADYIIPGHSGWWRVAEDRPRETEEDE